jgi:hypothetical protein
MPVGSFPANAFGLHDMHGNAEEFTEFCVYGSDLDLCFLRGGSWITSMDYLHVARSGWTEHDHRSNAIGFRVARTEAQPAGPPSYANHDSEPRLSLDAEMTRRSELMEKSQLWNSCSYAFGVLAAIDHAIGNDTTANVQALTLMHEIAVGHLVLTGKSGKEAKAILQSRITDSKISRFDYVAKNNGPLAWQRMAQDHSANCVAKLQNPDYDLAYVIRAVPSLWDLEAQ